MWQLYWQDNAQELELITLNLLNAELNPICHLLALLGAHHILHVSGIRVKAAHCQPIFNFHTCIH